MMSCFAAWLGSSCSALRGKFGFRAIMEGPYNPTSQGGCPWLDADGATSTELDPASKSPGEATACSIPERHVRAPITDYESCLCFSDHAVFAAAFSGMMYTAYGSCLFQHIANQDTYISRDYSAMGCAEMAVHLIRGRFPTAQFNPAIQ